LRKVREQKKTLTSRLIRMKKSNSETTYAAGWLVDSGQWRVVIVGGKNNKDVLGRGLRRS